MCLLAAIVSGCASGSPVDGASYSDDSDGGLVAVRAGAASGPGDATSGDAVAALETDLTNFKERLIGLDAEKIGALFGAPSLERSEPPTSLWQYRDPACTVDIFMFEGGRAPRVDHVDVRMAPKSLLDEKGCFREHLKKKISMNQ